MLILDSGDREMFETGANRDIKNGKGRCDLLPLSVISKLLNDDTYIKQINAYINTGEIDKLYGIINTEGNYDKNQLIGIMLELSSYYQAGALKYGERNWEKGIPLHSYIDSALRHYLKYLRGDTDENHYLAFIWNVISAIWTHENIPEMIDLPFKFNN